MLCLNLIPILCSFWRSQFIIPFYWLCWSLKIWHKSPPTSHFGSSPSPSITHFFYYGRQGSLERDILSCISEIQHPLKFTWLAIDQLVDLLLLLVRSRCLLDALRPMYLFLMTMTIWVQFDTIHPFSLSKALTDWMKTLMICFVKISNTWHTWQCIIMLALHCSCTSFSSVCHVQNFFKY
jgi:hypothetical protein